ncbi:MAG TPA: endolytic transglycosylase MltG [Cryomorphaceae bacterium]|nr:endolytic transglycosylase MltG [Cryomorphaceae bacterium]
MRKFIIIVGVVLPASLIFLVFTGYNMLFEANVNEQVAPYTLYVDEKMTIEDLYALLVEDDVLLAPEGFLLLANKKGLTAPKTGHYVLTASQSSNSIVNTLLAGFQEPVRIQFNSAENLEDLAGQLASQLMTDSISLLEAFNETRVGWEDASALGAYLPDTYEVYWNASAAAIAEKLNQNTVRFWSKDRIAQAAALGLTPAEVSTLASIVMKESSKADDRSLVARLYLNRLEKGIKLQADPTVIHAIKRANPGAIVRRVLKKDLDMEDPYNTYYVKGLPPGPLCVPEKAALLAVLNASEHEYIFMCANPDQPGYHVFAKNYAAHLVNQRKWTRYLNERKIYR